jgi:quaternary ammonium compound-resistance protein SugE
MKILLGTSFLAWLFLILAGLFEVIWALSMKVSEGFTKHWATGLTLVAACLSLWLLCMASKTLPIGTAYAAWTGIGTIGVAAMGMFLFNEPATLARIGCIGLIVTGVIGLQILSNH